MVSRRTLPHEGCRASQFATVKIISAHITGRADAFNILVRAVTLLVTLIWIQGVVATRRMGLERVVWLILIGRRVHSSRGARGLEAAT